MHHGALVPRGPGDVMKMPLQMENLPQQFDEYIWFDRTSAVTPLDTAEVKGLPDTYPFGV